MKKFIAATALACALNLNAAGLYEDANISYYGINQQIYETGDELRESYNQRLEKRYGSVTPLAQDDRFYHQRDLVGQLLDLRRDMRINEEIIVRVKKDPQAVIEIRIEDHESLIAYADSLFGRAVSVVAEVMYLGAPQNVSDVIKDAQETIERLQNGEVNEVDVLTDYKLKASVDARGKEGFSYLDKVMDIERLAQRMSRSPYYYGGPLNIMRSAPQVESRIIEVFTIQ